MECTGPERLDPIAALLELGIFGESGNRHGTVGVFKSLSQKQTIQRQPCEDWTMLGVLLYLSWVLPELLLLVMWPEDTLEVSKPAFLDQDTFRLAEEEL